MKNSSFCWYVLMSTGVIPVIFFANEAFAATPVYYCTFDSEDAIANPVAGGSGKIWNASFKEGIMDNALYVPASAGTVSIPFDNGLPPRKGCIEFWAKLETTSPSFTWGGSPRFFNFNRVGTDTSAISFLEINANDGGGGGGWHVFHGNASGSSTSYANTSTYDSVFSSSDYQGWHHYALKWNIEGVAGDKSKLVDVAVDGMSVLSIALADCNVTTFSSALMEKNELLFSLQKDSANPTDNRVPFLIDEFKIWDSDSPNAEVSVLPVIKPNSGTTFNDSLTISMTCEGEGATIHYTTDGTTPTIESPVYKKFRIWGKTTIKAIGFYNDGSQTEMATSLYAKGLCAPPVISAEQTFTGTKNKVTISCETDGAKIYFTTDGSAPTLLSTWYDKPFCVTNSCTIKAIALKGDFFDSDVSSSTLTRVWSIGDTMGASDHSFETSGDNIFVSVMEPTLENGVAMKSGTIQDDQHSVLSTTLFGPGTLTFKWKTSCEEDSELHQWDHAELAIDGHVQAVLDGENDWITVVQRITGKEEHSITWKYVKDGDEKAGDDCMLVGDYVWTPDYAETQTTQVPIPYAWLKGKCSDVVDDFSSYEKVAKQISLNGRLSVEECYVAGVDPESATNDFRVLFKLVDGIPKISWSPDQKADRVYKIWGTTNITDNSTWEYPTNALHRFFKVTVEMP